MPYNSNEDLPAGVRRGLSDVEQRQWRHVFNKCLADGKDEGTCHKMANGVVKGSKEFVESVKEVTLEDGTKDYQYVGSYEYESRQYDQNEAGYKPISGDSAKACSNCRFFVSPARCTIVSGIIAPNGVSDLWTAERVYEEFVMPVRIVKDLDGDTDHQNDTLTVQSHEEPANGKKSVVERITDWVSNLTKHAPFGATLGGVRTGGETLTKAFSIKEMPDGTVRWFARMSNNFMDRQGETFTEESHKEFVDWAEKSGSYPELWLWHIPGSKFGTTDWMEYSDGFVHASGTIDSDPSAIALAKSLEEGTEELGTSHGFICLKTKDGTIVQYRSYELSPLPLDHAANGWTAFNLLKAGDKEYEMPFSDVRKKFLQSKGVSEALLTEWEADTEKLSASLKEQGISFKSIMEDAEGETVLADEVAHLTKSVYDVVGAFEKKLETVNGELETVRAELKKSKDEILSDEYTARVAQAVKSAGFSATSNPETVVAEGEKTIAGKAAGKDWMDEIVFAPAGLAPTVPTS